MFGLTERERDEIEKLMKDTGKIEEESEEEIEDI